MVLERPVLFNTRMVQSILAGHKTSTRRIVKAPYSVDVTAPYNVGIAPYSVGDVLYVRETWAEWTGGYVYKADGAASPYPLSFVDRWHPSIHMPKAAARLFLEVTAVRAERLQDISVGDILREGLNGYGKSSDDLYAEWKTLWDSTIKKSELHSFGWEANPWVWVVDFSVIHF